MAIKIFGGEAVPKVFQTFNSLLGGIVRKTNATLVGPSKQLVGEFPEVDFERLYQYYHHWDQIKTAVDVMHQKFRGSGIEIKSNNEYFNTFIEKWLDGANAEKKWSQYIFSLLITGSAIMELQYAPAIGIRPPRMGNIEQIPMQTIYRIFRDQFGNELKLVQIVDGVFKELDPKYFIHSTINNPDRQAFGKSMFHTLASPRPIIGTVDQFTGDAINPARQSMPLLDAQAELQNAEIEIKKKMAKPRMLVSAVGMQQPQMDKLQQEMSDPNTDQMIWIFDKPIQSAELQIQSNGKFDEYGSNVDAHIDVGTIFASNVIKNPQGFSYSGSQTPFDVLDQRMSDLQSELVETIKDRLLKPLALSWGFNDFDAMEVKLTFTPTMKRLTMEDIRGLDPLAVSKKEIREMYKKLNIPLDDKLWEEEQKELKQDKQDQKNIQMQGAINGLPPESTKPMSATPEGDSPKGASPSAPANKKPKSGGGSPTVPEPKIDKTPFEMDRPKPEPVKKGENLHQKLIRAIANENLTPAQMIEAIKAVERIPLPPRAGSDGNSGSDLYVSQGLDDVGKEPEITDPAVRDLYGLDKEEKEQDKPIDGVNKQTMQPSDNTQGRFTNNSNNGIPQIPVKSEKEYLQHLQASGDHIIGGDTNDGINSDSDGSFKDPTDANNDMERTPEVGNTAIPNPHPKPSVPPLVNKPTQMSGGSDPLPDNTNKQILGGNDDDEEPIVPSEGFNNDKKKNVEAVKPTMPEKPIQKFRPNPVPDNRDLIEGEDPFTSGTGEEQTPELNNQPRKQQSRLDDSPLQQPSANKGNINGINPNTNNTSEELPVELNNDDSNPDNPLPPPFDKTDNTNTTVGDSGQVRLQQDEQTGIQQDQLLPNDSNSILDNTGLNMKPDFRNVTQDDYNKRVQDGSNPLEKRGEPLEDGMIIKPEDVQQNGGINSSPNTPTGTTVHDQDINTVNDPSDSGIDEEQVDPNILHVDPETGINYTDLTDEQGNEVPDLRFDQTPTSVEEQPEVELEYEIVTKEEYEQHLDSSKNQMNQDELTQEPNILDLDPSLENPLDPTEKDEQGNPVELQNADPNIEVGSDEIPKGGSPKGASPKSKTSKKSDSSPKPKEGSGETPKEEPTKDSSPKPNINDSGSGSNKKTFGDAPKDTKEKSKKSPKKEKNTGEDKPKEDLQVEDLPDVSGDVDNIIKREHELMDNGVPEDEIHDILIDEFNEDDVVKHKKGKKENDKENN